MKVTKQLVDHMLTQVRADFNPATHYTYEWDSSIRKGHYEVDAPNPTTTEVLLCNLASGRTVGTNEQLATMKSEYQSLIDEYSSYKDLLLDIAEYLLIKDHRRMIGSELTDELRKERAKKKFKSESITLNEDAFSIAAFKQYYTTHKLTAANANKYAKHIESWDNVSLKYEVEEFLWNTAATKTLALVKTITDNFYYKRPFINYFTVCQAYSLTRNTFAMGVIQLMNYSSTFVIVEGLSKSNWGPTEITLCIAYLQILPTNHWVVDWIWDNCPITQDLLDQQYQPVTMRK